MRILVSGDIFADSFARNIVVTAEHMGHEVLAVEASPLPRRLNSHWLRVWRMLLRAFPYLETKQQGGLVKAARNFAPDLVLVTHGELAPEVIREVKSVSDAVTAVWYPDHLANLDRQYVLASAFDGWFFKDPYMSETFRTKLGLNAYYLPEACNPLWHRRVPLTDADRRKYGCDLATASNMYYYRARMLETFKGYDLKIWGRGYPRWLDSPLGSHHPGTYVAELEKAKAFNAAKIVLNTMHYGEIAGVNCRLFEAAGCGAFQIADWKPALPELFEPEREVVTFRDRQELKDKVDYYLAHPEERQEIADRGYSRAHRDHTYESRLKDMFKVLGLSLEASICAPRADFINEFSDSPH